MRILIERNCKFPRDSLYGKEISSYKRVKIITNLIEGFAAFFWSHLHIWKKVSATLCNVQCFVVTCCGLESLLSMLQLLFMFSLLTITRRRRMNLQKRNVVRKWKEEMRKNLIWILEIETLWWGEKRFLMWEEVSKEKSGGKEWKKNNGGEDGGKNGRNNNGGITTCRRLFISIPCNYEYVNERVFLF